MGRVYLLQSIILFVFLAIFVFGNDLGKPCEDDSDCVENGVCQKKGSIKVCACQKGFRKDGAACTALATCNVTKCQSKNDSSATCGSDGPCQCSSGFYAYVDYCEPVVETGCNDTTCRREGDTQAVCNVEQKYCECSKEFFRLKDTCYANVGSNCYEDDDCVLNGVCEKNGTDFKCDCKLGFNWNITDCVLETDDQCKDRCQKTMEFTDGCDAEKNCTCSKGYTLIDGSCVETDEQCLTRCGKDIDKDVTCNPDTTCKCSQGYILKDGKCVEETNEDCLARCGKAINPNVKCENKECVCDEGFHLIPSYGFCVKVLGNGCGPGMKYCSKVTNAKCNEEKLICECPKGWEKGAICEWPYGRVPNMGCGKKSEKKSEKKLAPQAHYCSAAIVFLIYLF